MLGKQFGCQTVKPLAQFVLHPVGLAAQFGLQPLEEFTASWRTCLGISPAFKGVLTADTKLGFFVGHG